MATCWERANLLALLYVMFSCVFVTLPCDVLGQMRLYLFLIFAFLLTLYMIRYILNWSPFLRSVNLKGPQSLNTGLDIAILA